jgi:DNA-binding MarR family transcriptional regulator
MATKKKAAKVGGGAVAAAQGLAANDYIKRLRDDEDLRANLVTAYESARNVFERVANGKGPSALLDDKKTQRELRTAAQALQDASEGLRGSKGKKRRRGGLFLVVTVGAGLALVLSEDLRKRALDLLFGAEEEFEYTSTTSSTPGTTVPVPNQPLATDMAGASSAPDLATPPPPVDLSDPPAAPPVADADEVVVVETTVVDPVVPPVDAPSSEDERPPSGPIGTS